MKGKRYRSPVPAFALGLLFAAASLPLVGQDEKYYRHADGHRLDIWPLSEGASLSLEVADEHYSAELSAAGVLGAATEVAVSWTWYDDAGEEQVAGSGTLRLSEQTVVLSVAAKPGQRLAATDPSGVYRRLTEKDRLDLALAEYREADQALNRAYGEIRSALEDRPELWEDLRQRQRDWIEYRDHIAEHPASVGYERDKETSPGYWEMMAGLTESRIEFLKIFSGDAVPPGREGFYRDEHGGLLTIEKADAEGLSFKISVVRGPTFHLGEISARARYDEAKPGEAVFVDTDREAFIDGQPCTIRFRFQGKRVEVKTENSMYYHGARAYFDGEYFKESDLDGKGPLQVKSQEVAPLPPFVSQPAATHEWRSVAMRLNRRAATQPAQVYFLGDSLTEYWQTEGHGVWQLDFAPLEAVNFGVAADRIENILWRLEHGNLGSLKPKLFVLMMGTNNLAGLPRDSPRRVVQGIATVIDFIAERQPQAEFLLMSILPSGYEADSPLRVRIEETNRLLDEWCEGRQKVGFVDVYRRLLDPNGRWAPGMTVDGTHLKSRGYDVLANALRSRLAAALSNATVAEQ